MIKGPVVEAGAIAQRTCAPFGAGGGGGLSIMAAGPGVSLAKSGRQSAKSPAPPTHSAVRGAASLVCKPATSDYSSRSVAPRSS
jgi:hypothetical protein